MTRTEDRLADALAARAAGVLEESLRPLAAVPDARARSAWQGWRWLAPLAAALSVAVIAAMITFLAPTPSHGGPAAPPRYYAWYRNDYAGRPIQLVVRSAVTGAVVAQVPDPPGVSGWLYLGAARGLRSYVAVTFCGRCDHYAIYRFRLTRAGRVTDMALVRQVTIPSEGGFALAPDGLALAFVIRIGSPSPREGQAAQIGVLNLRTGTKRVWHGGLSRVGSDFEINSLSWSREDRTLAFAGQWCKYVNAITRASACTAWTVRSLNTAAPGGSLASGSVLLRKGPHRYPTNPPVISPDGSALLTVGALGPSPDSGWGAIHREVLISLDLATGSQTVLQRWTGLGYEGLIPTGGVVLVTAEHHPIGPPPRVIGWIGPSGAFQSLPAR